MSHEGNDKIIDNLIDNACAVENCDCMKDFPNCDPFVNFDHSDCTGDECKFDDGAYL